MKITAFCLFQSEGQQLLHLTLGTSRNAVSFKGIEGGCVLHVKPFIDVPCTPRVFMCPCGLHLLYSIPAGCVMRARSPDSVCVAFGMQVM
jgi:hypothetical protein